MNARALLDADMATVGSWLRIGLCWWRDELAAMLPRRLRGTRRARLPLVHYDPLLGLMRPGADGGAEPLAAQAGNRAVVLLPATLCLQRRIERPAVSDRDLPRMLALDRDRIMPLPGDAILVAGCIAERPADSERVTIEVAGLPIANAASIVDALATARCTADAILVEPMTRGAPRIDLLPAMREAGLLGEQRGRAYGWWLAVAALMLLNLGMMIWRDVARVDRLDQLVQAQQPAVDTAQRISRRIERVDRLTARTIALRKREPLGLLALLGDSLPPGVWIQRLNWSDEGLRLAGYRPKSADIAGSLRRRAGLIDVRYTNSDAGGAAVASGEPFEIAARLERH